MKKHQIIIGLLICMGLTFIFSSCKEKVSENLLLLIENRTDSPIYIRLYPKKTTASGGFYPMSDRKKGVLGILESDLSLHEDRVLYYSKDLTVKPYVLTSNIFDSIYVRKQNSDTIIKFTHNSVIGYSENIFAENSIWDYKIEEWSKHTMKNSEVRDYRYTFIISDEKIEIR